MKQIFKIKELSKGLFGTILRFPVVLILLIAAVITNAYTISINEEPNTRMLISFLLGASIFIVLQTVYERFLINPTNRYLFTGLTIVFTIIYYLLIRTVEWDIKITIRTIIIFFILLIAFLWIPVIKSIIYFNESFLAAFKAFFLVAFFYGVLFLGIVLIINTVDLLLFPVSERAFMHAANIIFLLFAPMHFLSLIPYYPTRNELLHIIQIGKEKSKTLTATDDSTGEEPTDNNQLNKDTKVNKEDPNSNIIHYEEREEALFRLITPTKFLGALVSYVIIPITGIFTIILLLYIITNITGEFWTDNLMEPLLVTFSIVVIIVYLLASTIHNAFTKYFKLIFPKVLVPVVLFQTISSILRIGEVGITYGRYYVIMFGIFATVAGIIFSLKPVQKNGLIAPILIALSLISILPFIDVFTISRVSQLNRLVNTLERNDMFDGEKVTPKADIAEKDKKIIISSVRYLNQMDDIKNIDWLAKYNENNNFGAIFGFDEYNFVIEDGYHVSIIRKQNSPIPIMGYDFMTQINVYQGIDSVYTGQFEKDGKVYTFRYDNTDRSIKLEMEGSELIRFNIDKIFVNYVSDYQTKEAETREVTFTEENSNATLTVVANSINIDMWEEGKNEQAEIFVLFKILQ